MLKIDEDLHYLTKILGAQALNQRLADFFCEKLVQRLFDWSAMQEGCGLARCTRLSQGFVNYVGVVKVVVREEVELVQKIPYVDATQRIHLRERQDARKSISSQLQRPQSTVEPYASASVCCSCMNQLTLMTFSYSSRELMAIGM